MKLGGGGKPSGVLLELINRDFGSFDGFVKEFKAYNLFPGGLGFHVRIQGTFSSPRSPNPRKTQKKNSKLKGKKEKL